MLSGNQFGNACATLMAGILCAAALSAQPGKLLGPAQQSAMQDSNLKPALPGALAGVGIDQRLNQQLPLDVNLKDEYGRDVKLRDFFKAGKPVILAPVNPPPTFPAIATAITSVVSPRLSPTAPILVRRPV